MHMCVCIYIYIYICWWTCRGTAGPTGDRAFPPSVFFQSYNYRTALDYVENNLYKNYDNRTFNNTSNVYKNINSL